RLRGVQGDRLTGRRLRGDARPAGGTAPEHGAVGVAGGETPLEGGGDGVHAGRLAHLHLGPDEPFRLAVHTPDGEHRAPGRLRLGVDVEALERVAGEGRRFVTERR